MREESEKDRELQISVIVQKDQGTITSKTMTLPYIPEESAFLNDLSSLISQDLNKHITTFMPVLSNKKKVISRKADFK